MSPFTMFMVAGLLFAVAVVAEAAERGDLGEGSSHEGITGKSQLLTGFVSVGTFNTYLYSGAPAVQDRKSALIRTLQNGNDNSNKMPEILCLQEVFRRSIAVDIVREVGNIYPYHASFENLRDDPSSRPACSVDEIQVYNACLIQCAPPPGNAVNNCSLVKCHGVKAQLTQSCFSCLVLESCYNFEESSEADVLAVCSSKVPANDYTAAYGLLLLSKYPLSNVTAEDYVDSYQEFITPLQHGYITAKIDGYTFVCTHLQPLLPAVYAGPPHFNSYEEKQAGEVKVLHQISKDNSNVILLGDFNHGPAIPGCEAEASLNYGLMVSNGMLSATVQWINQCTYCEDNTLLVNVTRANLVIDHIYLHASKASAVVEVSRMFEAVYTAGPPVFHLSDHYGVKAILDFTKMEEESCSAGDTLRMDDMLFSTGRRSL